MARYPSKEEKAPKKLDDVSTFWTLDRARTPTGIYALDVLMAGGTEDGDVVEFASESGLGKSTTMLNVAKNRLAMSRKVAYLDVEMGTKRCTLTTVGLPEPSATIGAPFLMACPTTWEDVDTILQSILNIDDPYDDIILDSITATIPASFKDLPISDANKRIGEKARYQSFFFDKYKPIFRWKKSNFWFINQVRVKIDLKGISELDSAGGQACKFAPDIRLMATIGPAIKRSEYILGAEKPEDVIYGNNAHIWCQKNRGERSHIKVDMPIIFGRGVSNLLFLKGVMQECKVITGGGGGFFKVKWREEPDTIRGTDELHTYIKQNIVEMHKWMTEQGFLRLVTEVK